MKSFCSWKNVIALIWHKTAWRFGLSEIPNSEWLTVNTSECIIVGEFLGKSKQPFPTESNSMLKYYYFELIFPDFRVPRAQKSVRTIRIFHSKLYEVRLHEWARYIMFKEITQIHGTYASQHPCCDVLPELSHDTSLLFPLRHHHYGSSALICFAYVKCITPSPRWGKSEKKVRVLSPLKNFLRASVLWVIHEVPLYVRWMLMNLASILNGIVSSSFCPQLTPKVENRQHCPVNSNFNA